MDELLKSLVNTDDIVLLLAHTPHQLRPYLLAVQQFNENPLPKSSIEVVNGVHHFYNLDIPFTQGIPVIHSVKKQDNLVRELAKIDGIEGLIRQQQVQSTKEYTALFNPLLALAPISNLDLVCQFDEASTLVEAFVPYKITDHEINLLPNCIPDTLNILQSALACKMAGLNYSAILLIQKFIEAQLVEMNEGYQTLLTRITKQKGHLEKLKNAAKKGGKKRQEPSQKTKNQAIELFLAGEYKNYSVAAGELFPQIQEIGKENGFPFNSYVNGIRTVTDWLRSTKRYSK